MTNVADLIEQAKQLTPADRQVLIDSLKALEPEPAQPFDGDHWGKSLNALLDEVGPIEMKYPEIEDPVEWVKQLRADRRRHRLRNLEDDE